MTIDYVNLGSTPPGEDCAQVGSDGYHDRAIEECNRFRKFLREKIGKEPSHARLAVRSFPHDFGNYLEVVCYFDTNVLESEEYAMKCENDCPEYWEEEDG